MRRVETPIQIIDSIRLARKHHRTAVAAKMPISAGQAPRDHHEQFRDVGENYYSAPQQSVLAIGIPRSAPDGGDGGLTESGNQPGPWGGPRGDGAAPRRRSDVGLSMARTFGLDVLACPRCGGRLRLIALIEQAAVSDRILRHLGVSTQNPAPRPARAPPLRVGARHQAGWDARALGVRLLSLTILNDGRPVGAPEVRAAAQGDAPPETFRA